MKKLGYINEKQEKDALAKELEYENFTNQILAPHFVLYIRDLLIEKYGRK